MTPPVQEGVRRVTLNGRTGGLSSAAGWIQALNDPVLVHEKGGFLFKASHSGDHLVLAVAPAMIQGVLRKLGMVPPPQTLRELARFR